MAPDPAKVRKILENPDVAKWLGFTPQDQRPEAIVSAGTPQARLDELIAAGYRPVIDEQLTRALGQLPDPPRFETNPDTGPREYKGSFDSITAASPGLSLSAGYTSSRPQAIMERPPVQYLRTQGSVQAELDRFAGNPGEAWFRSIMPGATFAGPAPTMFATGELPPITASGLDPSVLRWVAWPLRHSAAFTESRARVLLIIEESASPAPDFDALQIDAGRDALQDYFARTSQWVVEPAADQPIGQEELEQYAASLWPAETEPQSRPE